MNPKYPAILMFCVFAFGACAETAISVADKMPGGAASGAKIENNTDAANAAATENAAAKTASTETEIAASQTRQPRTVREFFNLLPQKYFTLEGCAPAKDKNCDRARSEYVKNFLEIEDAPNGYWKSGCDGAQSCLTLALFKRPDATYIVHILTEFEAGEDSYFLEYKNGKWSDIGASVVPEFSAGNTYVPPRKGTTVEVFKKNFPEPEYSERGAKIYELQWKNGKFVRQR